MSLQKSNASRDKDQLPLSNELFDWSKGIEAAGFGNEIPFLFTLPRFSGFSSVYVNILFSSVVERETSSRETTT
ncbi:hypothetical protein CEXT_419671 [Caerostris extrusa]|uniref:Uncharacterized protein n=1 Tax=Caerostris extrusa TaxID=172846 RepID=A0AAV4W4Q8_CAEEX|nr:hypothetical protein CEXT_419671 [Caerostris extrusa]